MSLDAGEYILVIELNHFDVIVLHIMSFDRISYQLPRKTPAFVVLIMQSEKPIYNYRTIDGFVVLIMQSEKYEYNHTINKYPILIPYFTHVKLLSCTTTAWHCDTDFHLYISQNASNDQFRMLACNGDKCNGDTW